MPIDYLGLRQQAKQAAVQAAMDLERVKERTVQAKDLFREWAKKPADVQGLVAQAAQIDPRIRCAVPTDESIDRAMPLPKGPATATLIAADGSQINPNPHEPVHYFLVNLGAIQMQHGSDETPVTYTQSQLHLTEYTSSGSTTAEQVNLERDKEERLFLANLAANAQTDPIITLTDGPLELWGEKTQGLSGERGFSRDLVEYLAALDKLRQLGSATAGYVDKPRADLIVRMLEIISFPPEELGLRLGERPLRGVTDAQLVKELLAPGERSAVFRTQSQSATHYAGDLALHFFYLNVGRAEAGWMSRVEIPAWVAKDKSLLNSLHAVLVDQCKILGDTSYPYVLHRAHEIALVRFEEHEQVSQLLISELRGLGVEPGMLSHKQAAKNLSGRRRFTIGSSRI